MIWLMVTETGMPGAMVTETGMIIMATEMGLIATKTGMNVWSSTEVMIMYIFKALTHQHWENKRYKASSKQILHYLLHLN